MDRTMPSGGGLRLATLLLCSFNVVVAVYLSYVVLLPLAFRLSDTFPSRGHALDSATQELVKAEYTQFLGTPEQECNIELNTDYDGFAVRWGLEHLKETAADCCAACLASARGDPEGAWAVGIVPSDTLPNASNPRTLRCNTWVYCPQPGGCWSPDIYDHKHKECWLKYSEKPLINYKGKFPDEFRKIHVTAPELVDWTSGRLKA